MVSSVPHTAERSKPMPVKTGLDRERGIVRTSKRMPTERAQRLCQRLANLSGILQPEVTGISHKTDTARVVWQPVNPGSREHDLAGFIAWREARAAEQSEVMSFYALEGRYQQFVCLNEDLHGGISHLVDLGNKECDCEDFRYRCMGLANHYETYVPCHHLIEIERRLESGEPLVNCPAVELASEPLPAPMVRERPTVSINPDLDFP